MEKEKKITPSIINVHTPLIQPNGTHKQIHDSKINNKHDSNDNMQQQMQEEQSQQTSVVANNEEDDTQLDKILKKLEFHLRIMGFDQTTPLKFVISWLVFFFVGVAVPMLIIELTHCFDCEDYQVKDFEYEILTSHLLLSGVSLICVAFNLHKKGFRKFLFVDRQRGYTSRFKDQYIKKINGFYRLLLQSLIPCCILKAIHEIIRMIYLQNQSWWLAILNASALIISWTYLSAISLIACMLFHLACNLQVIHFNDYANCLEKESSITTLMDEHMRLRGYLSKISHRFRIYLILVFLLVTASLCMTLVQITGVNGKVTFLNGGNFAVTSIVQVVETLLCLHAGTKISSRAQGIGAVACRWHADVSCRTFEGSKRSISLGSLSSNFSDNELSLLDESSIVSHSPFSSVYSYNKRQSFGYGSYSKQNLDPRGSYPLPTLAWSTYYLDYGVGHGRYWMINFLSSLVLNYTFIYAHLILPLLSQHLVMYLQANPGGLTLYGWTVDRSLLSTIFAIELSLVLFVLGQTIVFSSPQ